MPWKIADEGVGVASWKSTNGTFGLGRSMAQRYPDPPALVRENSFKSEDAEVAEWPLCQGEGIAAPWLPAPVTFEPCDPLAT